MPLFENKKIVISGGPGSGKSTLVGLLRRKGYKCVDEFSRTLIENAQKMGENNIFKTPQYVAVVNHDNGCNENAKVGTNDVQKTFPKTSCKHAKIRLIKQTAWWLKESLEKQNPPNPPLLTGGSQLTTYSAESSRV